MKELKADLLRQLQNGSGHVDNSTDNSKMERGAYILYCDILLDKCLKENPTDAEVRGAIDYLIGKLKQAVEDFYVK